MAYGIEIFEGIAQMEASDTSFYYVLIFLVLTVQIRKIWTKVGATRDGQKQKEFSRALLKVNRDLMRLLMLQFRQIDWTSPHKIVLASLIFIPHCEF